MYLFAIQLPSSVNYPPTIKDAYLGHRIEYSLQGHLDLLAATVKSTPLVPLTYLPLVTLGDNQVINREKTVSVSDTIQVTAKLVKPSSCPGNLPINSNKKFNWSKTHIFFFFRFSICR
jgi:hypothetical protein